MARATTGIAYAMLGLVVLGGLVFTVFVTVPAWSTWRATGRVLAGRSAARDERIQFLQNIEVRLQELKTYEKDARALAVAFPEQDAPADAVASIAALATRNGLTAKLVTGPTLRRTSAPTPAPTVQEQAAGITEGAPAGASSATKPPPSASRGAVYEFRVRVQGTYAGVSGFIRDIEKSARFYDLQSVETKGRSEDGSVEADFVILTYIAETGGTFLRSASAAAPPTASPGAATSTPTPTP